MSEPEAKTEGERRAASEPEAKTEGERRALRRAVIVLAAATALVLSGAWVLRAPASLPESLVAVDGTGVATPLALVTRVPAVSDGGVDYSTTQLTLDKATAKAADVTPGDLAESFLEISDRPLDSNPDPTGLLPDLTLDPTTPDPNDHLGKYQPSSAEYHNPVLVRAQYPPSADQAVPTSAQSPDGGARVFATEAPLAHAEANGGKTTVTGVVTIGAGSSSSQSELTGNGTVVTTTVAQVKDVLIGGVLSIASASSRAVASVPESGDGTVDLKVTASGVAVNGVPAQLTPDGIQVNDQVPLSAAQLAGFNEGLASLDGSGIAIRMFPDVSKSTSTSSAAATGGVLSIHYNFTGRGLPASPLGDAPYNEELVLARVNARSVGRHRSPSAVLGANDLPSLDSGAIGGEQLASGALGSVSPSGSLTAPVGARAAVVQAGNGDLNLVRTRVPAGVTRLRDYYRFIVLLAFIGAAVLLARRRTRLS